MGADRTPYVAWHLDPLPPGSKNEVQIDIGKERAAREHMLEAAGWISSPQYADSEFFGKTPATELAYEWLWDDLRRVSWVKGMFNRRFSGFTSTSGSNKTAMFSLLSSSTRPGHCKCSSKTSNMLCGAETAQDLGRYDFIKDIGRVENIVTDRAPRASGYVILLTNDPSYWTQSRNDNTADVRFRLHEGNTLHGGLGWGPGASAGTTRGREELLQIGGSYALQWEDYSRVGGGSYGELRYLVVEVKGRVATQVSDPSGAGTHWYAMTKKLSN